MNYLYSQGSIRLDGAARSNRSLLRELMLFALLGVAVLSFSKGFQTGIPEAGEGYWFINYGHGLIRRGLLGQIFSLFQSQSDLNKVLSTALYVHLGACALLLFGLWGWLRTVLDRGIEALLLAIFAVFATSQFLPTQAYDAGFLDVYDYLLVLAAAVAILRNFWVLAGAIGFIGPFVHEGFLFVWFALAILALRGSPKLTVERIPALLAPLASTAIIYFVPTTHAAIAEMASGPLPQEYKDRFIAYQFGQTLLSSVEICLWKISNNFANFVMAVAFFTLPAAVMAIAYCITRRTLRDALTLLLATLSPAAILVVGWDLSRFLVATSFSGLLSVLFMQTARPVKAARLSVVIACWLFAALGALLPFVYGYYEVAQVVNRGPIPFATTPIGIVVTAWVSSYSRNIGPRVVPEVGTEEPPGTVWYEEEDAWTNTWTRRPGTNIFDAVGTKGGITVRCVLTIRRGGDRIRVVRTQCSDGNDLMYSGWLRGSGAWGTYPGGKWHATIR